MTNMDKLYEAVEARGPVCVGLDTDFSYLPADFVDSTLTRGEPGSSLVSFLPSKRMSCCSFSSAGKASSRMSRASPSHNGDS